jgi:signal transduction histidine kinase
MNWQDKNLLNSFLLRYGVTLVFFLGALLVTSALWTLVKPLSSPLFLGSIVLSAWWGGLRAGILATILSGLTIDFVFISPQYQFTGQSDNLLRLSVFVVEGTVMSWLISARSTAAEEVKNSREQLLALSLHQQTVREAEQKRISLEIHDELGQALTGMKMEVHWLMRQIKGQGGNGSQPAVTEKLSELSGMIDTTITSVRRISTELRPSILDDFGLIAAIEWQAREFERKTIVPCLLKSDFENLEMDMESSTAVFRIFQETLTNVTRHAGATAVKVYLKSLGERIVMRIEDNGRGIDLNKIKNGRSLGILGMRERARSIGGDLNISGGQHGGTIVELIFPLHSAARSN